jgi:hypothetical protein
MPSKSPQRGASTYRAGCHRLSLGVTIRVCSPTSSALTLSTTPQPCYRCGAKMLEIRRFGSGPRGGAGTQNRGEQKAGVRAVAISPDFRIPWDPPTPILAVWALGLGEWRRGILTRPRGCEALFCVMRPAPGIAVRERNRTSRLCGGRSTDPTGARIRPTSG